MKSTSAALFGLLSLTLNGYASVSGVDSSPLTSAAVPQVSPSSGAPPTPLPGNGLSRHPFLYTGEWDFRKPEQTIFLVREGKVAWSYSIPIKNQAGEMQELGDATRLSNGNILFSRKVGASEVTEDKRVVWNIEAARGTEIHSVQPIGLDRVLVTQNGNPAKLMLVNKKTGLTEKELTLSPGNPAKPHLQFRRVRQTSSGTYLAAHLDANKVVEYDGQGKVLWSFPAKGAWSAVRLKNGNTLITSSHSTILEVTKEGKVVWEFSEKDVPEYKCFIFQEASRLANGNTVVCSWCPVDLRDPQHWSGSVQVFEITPEKKVVWALSQWGNPDLGPASSIQLLDQPGVPENPGDQER